MQPLYTEAEFKDAKSRQLLPLRCLHCTKTFRRTKNEIVKSFLPHRCETNNFCSLRCSNIHRNPPVTVECHQCHKPFNKLPCEIRASKNNFCSHPCNARWQNAHKTKGTRVSKLEAWLSKKIPSLYPSLEFHFNRKDAINGELDIYIPSIRLAFELNGIFHYEPIFGPDKLASIKTNDARKAQACLEHGIELCLIDVSSFTYFKEQRAVKFLTIIQKIIDSKMVEPAEIESATSTVQG